MPDDSTADRRFPERHHEASPPFSPLVIWITRAAREPAVICLAAAVDVEAVRNVLAGFAGTRIIEADGDVYAIHDPDDTYELQPRQGWATIVTSNAHDAASDLDRPGVYRLNIGLTRSRFHELVDPSARYDTTARDLLFPHPTYGQYNWVCVLNPDRIWPTVRHLLVEAHSFAVRKHDNTARRRGSAVEDHR